MKLNFALSLSFDGIQLLRRMPDGWALIDEIALDGDGLDAGMQRLRDAAIALHPHANRLGLIIPNDQIRFLSLPAPPRAGGAEARLAAAREALDGITPYALSELAIDHHVTGGTLQVAAVARDTLAEAEAFAAAYGFEPQAHLAAAPAKHFAAAIFFGPAASWSGQPPQRPRQPIAIIPADADALAPTAMALKAQARAVREAEATAHAAETADDDDDARPSRAAQNETDPINAAPGEVAITEQPDAATTQPQPRIDEIWPETDPAEHASDRAAPAPDLDAPDGAPMPHPGFAQVDPAGDAARPRGFAEDQAPGWDYTAAPRRGAQSTFRFEDLPDFTDSAGSDRDARAARQAPAPNGAGHEAASAPTGPDPTTRETLAPVNPPYGAGGAQGAASASAAREISGAPDPEAGTRGDTDPGRRVPIATAPGHGEHGASDPGPSDPGPSDPGGHGDPGPSDLNDWRDRAQASFAEPDDAPQPAEPRPDDTGAADGAGHGRPEPATARASGDRSGGRANRAGAADAASGPGHAPPVPGSDAAPAPGSFAATYDATPPVPGLPASAFEAPTGARASARPAQTTSSARGGDGEESGATAGAAPAGPDRDTEPTSAKPAFRRSDSALPPITFTSARARAAAGDSPPLTRRDAPRSSDAPDTAPPGPTGHAPRRVPVNAPHPAHALRARVEASRAERASPRASDGTPRPLPKVTAKPRAVDPGAPAAAARPRVIAGPAPLPQALRATPAPGLPAPGPAAAGAAATSTTETGPLSEIPERDRMTVFGARGRDEIGGKPRFLGLMLTVGLLIFLAGVAAWATVFLDEGVARFTRAQPEDAAAPPPPAPEESGSVARVTPEPSVAPSDLPTAGAEPDAPGDAAPQDTQLAALEITPEAPATDAEPALAEPLSRPPLSAEEAAATYAATGIWQMAPTAPDGLPTGATDDVYVASIDPDVPKFDAVALPEVDALLPEAGLVDQGLPPPAGMLFDFDARGLVRATPDGALSPDGLRIFTGRPAVVPPLRSPQAARPETAPGTAGEVAPDPLRDVRPEARPSDLIEQNERAELQGISRRELAAFRPVARAVTAQERAAIEAPEATEQAVLASLIPVTRPRDMTGIVERAEARAAARARASATPPLQVASASAATVAPRRVQPDLPSSASVTRAATVQNAINLRRMNLIGVYGTQSNRRALVRMSNGRYVKVKVGDRLDGGTVRSIEASQLNYRKGSRTITLAMPRG